MTSKSYTLVIKNSHYFSFGPCLPSLTVCTLSLSHTLSSSLTMRYKRREVQTRERHKHILIVVSGRENGQFLGGGRWKENESSKGVIASSLLERREEKVEGDGRWGSTMIRGNQQKWLFLLWRITLFNVKMNPFDHEPMRILIFFENNIVFRRQLRANLQIMKGERTIISSLPSAITAQLTKIVVILASGEREGNIKWSESRPFLPPPSLWLYGDEHQHKTAKGNTEGKRVVEKLEMTREYGKVRDEESSKSFIITMHAHNRA